jgi:hypothetical protein
MIEKTIYIYELSGRRAAMIFVLAVSMLLLAIAASYSAPSYFLLPVCLSGVLALWAIVANPKTGSTLTAETLHFFNCGIQETVSIKDIVSMKITEWSDGPDTVTLYLKSGRVAHIPSLCADSQLAIALQNLGIPKI